jgi:hypothetical protein
VELWEVIVFEWTCLRRFEQGSETAIYGEVVLDLDLDLCLLVCLHTG